MAEAAVVEEEEEAQDSGVVLMVLRRIGRQLDDRGLRRVHNEGKKERGGGLLQKIASLQRSGMHMCAGL